MEFDPRPAKRYLEVCAALPRWARALHRLDRYAWYAYHFHEIVRDELLFAWLPPEQRAGLTELAYDHLATYLPGGSTFQAGLFDWERAVLETLKLPSRARLLLAAAGGGRELKAFAELGFRVFAFEPNAVLLAGAQQVARGFSDVSVVRAAYADLIEATFRERFRILQPFDCIWLGWGSFTHVTEAQEQRAVLQAARQLAPEAPLVLSMFLRTASGGVPAGRSQRLRRGLRRLLGTARDAVPPGLSFEYGGGFVYSFEQSEFHALAHASGYAVEHFSALPFPHAVLKPLAASSAAGSGAAESV